MPRMEMERCNSLREFKDLVAKRTAAGDMLVKIEVGLTCGHVIQLEQEVLNSIQPENEDEFFCPICDTLKKEPMMNPAIKAKAKLLLSAITEELRLGTQHFNKEGKQLNTVMEIVECLVEEDGVLVKPSSAREGIFKGYAKDIL